MSILHLPLYAALDWRRHRSVAGTEPETRISNSRRIPGDSPAERVNDIWNAIAKDMAMVMNMPAIPEKNARNRSNGTRASV